MMGKVHLVESEIEEGVRTYCGRLGIPAKKRGSYVTLHWTMWNAPRLVPFRVTHVDGQHTCKLCTRERQRRLFGLTPDELAQFVQVAQEMI